MGSAGGSAGGSADNVYFHPDTCKFDVVNVYIHAGGGDQGHHTRMGGGCVYLLLECVTFLVILIIPQPERSENGVLTSPL